LPRRNSPTKGVGKIKILVCEQVFLYFFLLLTEWLGKWDQP
jgi:hypothetical protein